MPRVRGAGERDTPTGAKELDGATAWSTQRSRCGSEKIPHAPRETAEAATPKNEVKVRGTMAPAVQPLMPAPSFCKAKDWLVPSEEEVAAASDKRCFLFPAWELLSDKRVEEKKASL